MRTVFVVAELTSATGTTLLRKKEYCGVKVVMSWDIINIFTNNCKPSGTISTGIFHGNQGTVLWENGSQGCQP